MANGNFKENLKQGESFEVGVVQPFLIKNFPDMWITPCHNYQVRAGYSGGPRMYRAGQKPIILPDFQLVSATDPSDRVLIETKVKRGPFAIAGDLYFGIDEYKCIAYENAATANGAKLAYIIGCEENRTLYMYPKSNFIRHTFNNSFSKFKPSVSRCFPMTDKYKIGTF